MDKLSEIIGRYKFRRATSEQYKKTPHEYAVLSQHDAAIAKGVIDRLGYTEKFFGHPYRYFRFDGDDKKYWVCGNILNRTDVKNIYGAQ